MNKCELNWTDFLVETVAIVFLMFCVPFAILFHSCFLFMSLTGQVAVCLIKLFWRRRRRRRRIEKMGSYNTIKVNFLVNGSKVDPNSSLSTSASFFLFVLSSRCKSFSRPKEILFLIANMWSKVRVLFSDVCEDCSTVRPLEIVSAWKLCAGKSLTEMPFTFTKEFSEHVFNLNAEVYAGARISIRGSWMQFCDSKW